MSGKTYIGTRAKSLDVSPKFTPYTKVALVVTKDTEYVAGTDEGRTLQLECPWGTQAMANDILSKIQGFEYQPFTVDSALLDPAAEIGDGVKVRDTYSGLYSIESTFGNLFVSRLSAPADEEIDHEFPFVSKQSRKIERQINAFRSELNIQADRITAKVESTGGNPESFGWQLLSDSWKLTSGNKTVFSADSQGVSIEGYIKATSGIIGDCSIVDGKLQVKAANITGVLKVTNSGGNTLLAAGDGNVTIGGWSVGYNSIHTTWEDSASRVFMCTGTNYQYTIAGFTDKWYFGAGSSTGNGFGVSTEGVLCAKGAKISGEITALSGSFGAWDLMEISLGNGNTEACMHAEGPNGRHVFLTSYDIQVMDGEGNRYSKTWVELLS